MENITLMKTVVKHLVDGTLDESLCRVCLRPLGYSSENIFTKICQDGLEYSVAEILELLCQVKFTERENHKVCSDCFIGAFMAYKLLKNFQRTSHIIEFYTNEILKNLELVSVSDNTYNDSICITLEEFEPVIPELNFDIVNFLNREYVLSHNDVFPQPKNCEEYDTSEKEVVVKPKFEKDEKLANNEDVVVIVKEGGEPTYYKLNDNGILEPYIEIEVEKMADTENEVHGKRKRKKRKPMPLVKCSRCDVQHRFLKRLQRHMKLEHNVDLFICKICKATFESEKEFNLHLRMHTDIHCCAICNAVFKRRDSIIAHLKWHEITNNLNADGNSGCVCEICGVILMNEEDMQDHYDKRHDSKHTCHFCGKRYMLQQSLDKHLQKHEDYNRKMEEKQKSSEETKKPSDKSAITKVSTKSSKAKKGEKATTCTICNRSFVDERALKWHTMLHNNERPYKCNQCGRGFISVNRRNQHTLCSHAPPTRRCPLCPALFHLRSMVNTHLKKVHLQTHKRRNRIRNRAPVSWRTEPVALQDLSVDIQHQVLQLQHHNTNHEELLQEAHLVPFEYDE